MFQPGATLGPDRRESDRPVNPAAPVRLLKAIGLAQTRAPGLTLTQLLVFLAVASEEGIRLNDLGARIGESQAVISRNVRALTRAGDPGSLWPSHGLLTLMRDRDDGRGRRAALSDAGHMLLVQIEQALDY